MKYKKWIDSKIKKIEMCDMFFIKISVIAFTLMLAKLWQPILNLNWYWYGIIFLLTAIKPMIKVFK
jgi:hypothetical protein